MLSKTQVKEWFNRYKHAELAAIITALLGSQFSRIFSGLTTAYLITFAEYFTFYSVIIGRTYWRCYKKLIIKNVLIEFGYPAFLDLLLVRPFFMYWLPILTGNALTGIMAGKICADVVFYFLTIMNYEVMKRKNYF
jgi:hypothetical protein